MKKRWIISSIILIIILLHFIVYSQINEYGKSDQKDKLNPDECGGFIATGSVCKDGRSILLKNRHSEKPGIMKPFYYQGNNYSFIAFGTYIKDVGRPYCRMGINEKGLAIGNFDQSELISNGNWKYISDHLSENEDYDMWYVLGNFETVKNAANWLVHHASYPCEWALVSEEKGVGALVAMDKQYHGNISWINNSYTAVGNRLYCEQSYNAQMERTQYLANQIYYQGIGIEPTFPYTFSFKDAALILAKDINASNVQYPWFQEPVSDQYTGHYSIGQNGSICPTSSTSCMLAISGNDSFNGSINLVFFTSGYNPHVGLFVPISSSYLENQNDIPLVFRCDSGLQIFTKIAQSYAEDLPGSYNRSKTHYIHNTTDLLECEMIDAYESMLNSIVVGDSNQKIQDMMQLYCYNQTYNSLYQYRDLFIQSITLVIPNESFNCGNVKYIFNKSLPFRTIENTADALILNSTICKTQAIETLNVTITFLSDNIQSTGVNQLLMEWYASNVGGQVSFNFSGFQPYCFYQIVNNEQSTFIQSTSNGNIVYSSLLGKVNHFQIKTTNYTDQLPNANFTFFPLEPSEGDIVAFDASTTNDDGGIIQYKWDLNNDHIVDKQGKKIEHMFSSAGSYLVNLTVIDTSNQTDWITNTVTIHKSSTSKGYGSGGSNPSVNHINIPPFACIYSIEPTQVSTNEIVVFNGSISYDSDGAIVGYYWDFGDSYSSEGMICNHTYLQEGTYMVIFTVIDDMGAMDTNTSFVTVHKQNLPPLKPIIQGEPCLQVNTSYNFLFRTRDYDNDNLTLTINWGDGLQTNTSIFSNTSFLMNHSWHKNGIYTIKAHVIDEFQVPSELAYYNVVIGEILCHLNDEINGYILKISTDSKIMFFYENETKLQCNVTEKNNGTYLIDYDNDGSWKYGYTSDGTLFLNIHLEQKETSGLEGIWVIISILFVCLCYFLIEKRNN